MTAPRGTTFIAQYSGGCAECGGRIVVGDVCCWLGRSIRHVTCPDDPDLTADKAALHSPRCPVCSLNHPGEC